MIIRGNGVNFSVKEALSVQCNAFLSRDVWSEYEYSGEEEERFTVNLSILLDCLNIFGQGALQQNSPTVQMAYRGYGTPFLILLEQNGVLTDCSLLTLEAEEQLSFNLKSSEFNCRLIVNSEHLYTIFSELDWSCICLDIFISNESPHFRISTDGTECSCRVEYSKDSEMFERFECKKDTQFTYKLKYLQPIIKSLGIAQKSQIRINSDGLLAMEHKILNNGGIITFIGCYLMPVDESDLAPDVLKDCY